MTPQPQTRRCIPLGCLLLRLSEGKIPSALWPMPNFKTWSRFVVHNTSGEPYPPDPCLAQTPALPHDWDKYLIDSIHKSYVKLLMKRWIEMSFCISVDDPGQGILRVYLLADDTDRRNIDRSDSALRKVRLSLLQNLDFSGETWRGNVDPSPSPSPISYDGDDRGNVEESLLQMFNNIPCPKPRPEKIGDFYAQDAAHELLGDEVAGLKSDLYPYQRRSAAVMLQRESQPERVLDPRLVKVKDQYGNPWYYDRVNGYGLHEPRTYDGVNGGILAEEMGAGKTLICLALILATKHQPSQIPDIYRGVTVKRPRVGSLADMAAANLTRNSFPWKPWFGLDGHYELDYANCRGIIQRNLGHYYMPRPERRQRTRKPVAPSPDRKIYLSYATLVVVPTNILEQWKQEVAKHTLHGSIRTLVITSRQKIPPPEELVDIELILFSDTVFAGLRLLDAVDHPLSCIHFKRCIIDEGHRIGSSTSRSKSNILLVLDSLQISARWVVTGTPAKGLFGVEQSPSQVNSRARRMVDSSDAQEKEDLKRIGNITTLYLRARPWANSITDYGDKPADWSVYVLQPKHSRRSNGRQDCLRATLDSLIIRHQLDSVANLLPGVKESIVYLDGSYQDRLSLNLFSMMIIFNAVQSQRTDQDYFFHPRQNKQLRLLVNNLRQASFFGGPFFRQEEVLSAVEGATKFFDEHKIPMTKEDESLLREAIAFGQLALNNELKQCSFIYPEVPLYVKDFPGGPAEAEAWSVDSRPGDPICTNAELISTMRRYLKGYVDAPQSLQILFDSGKFQRMGQTAREKIVQTEHPESPRKESATASPAPKSRRGRVGNKDRTLSALSEGALRREDSLYVDQDLVDVAEPLARTRIISTASAKLSYLTDQVVKYQKDEKIIIFYEHDNPAWYVTWMLDILDIPYLIYTGKNKVERRAQYVHTFNQNPEYRVMLMDIGQAAFGLDMHSASRIYFLNPVLDPQVEAQAVARARRISQKSKVTVETLVLRGSLDELIVQRKEEMTQAQQRNCKSILDDKPIKEWIKNAKILPLPQGEIDGLHQTSALQEPQYIFARGFGRTFGEDEGLVPLAPAATTGMSVTAEALNHQDGIVFRNGGRGAPASAEVGANEMTQLVSGAGSMPSKRKFDSVNGPLTPLSPGGTSAASPRPSRRVHFSHDEEDLYGL